MSRLKIIIILVLFSLFLTTLFFYLKINNVAFDQSFIAYESWLDPTDENLNRFFQISTSQSFLSQFKTVPKDLNTPEEVFDFLRKNQKPPTSLNIPAVLKIPKEVKTPIQFDSTSENNPNLPAKITYIIPGQLGYNIYDYQLLLFAPNANSLNSRYLNLQTHIQDPVTKQTFIGTQSEDDSKKTAQDLFTNTLKNLNDDTITASDYPELNSDSKTKLEAKEILQNIDVSSITFVQKDFAESDLQNNKIIIGTINLHLNNCIRDFSADLAFDVIKKQIVFDDMNKFIQGLCKKQFVLQNGVLTGTCEDCTFYPADKQHALRSDYVPDLQLIDFEPVGLKINKAAYQDLKDMFYAAKADGVYLYITSAYRSYTDQQSTFQAWVQSELDQGYSQSESVDLANTYSAYPGFSEHQLGTAVDLDGPTCAAFQAGCSSNEQVWNWLAQNASKYGFIQSYPDGKESVTGYETEPWHYRWIGKDLAARYVSEGGGTAITLNIFLFNNDDF